MVSIVSAIEQLTTMSEQIAGSMQTVAAATEEQNATMEEIGSASLLLSNMAEGLRKSVDRFKV